CDPPRPPKLRTCSRFVQLDEHGLSALMNESQGRKSRGFKVRIYTPLRDGNHRNWDAVSWDGWRGPASVGLATDGAAPRGDRLPVPRGLAGRFGSAGRDLDDRRRPGPLGGPEHLGPDPDRAGVRRTRRGD